MAHIQTFEALAEKLVPQLLDRSETGIVPQGFLNGGQPKRENWKRVINALFYAPLMRVAMQEFLDKPARMDAALLGRYTAQLEFTSGYVEHFGHKTLPAEYDPQIDLTHLLMAQRISHTKMMECMAVLERHPHFLLTIAHAQGFYCDYINRLEPCLMALVPSPPPKDPKQRVTVTSEEDMKKIADRQRMAQIIRRVENVVFGNQALFVGVMGFQFLSIHIHLAQQEGRPVGEMTLKDFMAFDRYTRSGKLFVQQGKQCPWSDAYHLGMQGKDAGADGTAINISGLQLWRLHQHIAPLADTKRSELREDVLRAGMMISRAIGDHVQQKKCPHRMLIG